MQTAGRVRLMALLSRIMIRAAKSDLVTIPPCHHKVSTNPSCNCSLPQQNQHKYYLYFRHLHTDLEVRKR